MLNKNFHLVVFISRIYANKNNKERAKVVQKNEIHKYFCEKMIK